MSYRAAPGPALRTRWDDEPIIRIINHRDAYGVIELSWATQPARAGWVARRTRVIFSGVVEYRWRYIDVDVESGEEGALELGEITHSGRLAELRRQGFGPDLRHFQVSFDEHGSYDVICRDLRAEYRAASRTGSPDAPWTGEPSPNDGG